MIKQIRKKIGLSQEEVGCYLNVTGQAVHNYEVGFRLMPVKTALKFIKLCKIHNIDIDLDKLYKNHKRIEK